MYKKPFIFSVLFYLLSAGNAFADPLYKGDVLCEGDTLPIPKSFPFTKNKEENFYLNVLSECSEDNFTVILGRVQDCKGENFCLHGSFSKSLIDNDQISSKIGRGLLSRNQSVNLINNAEAVYIPSTCAAYCTEADLIWSKGNYVYALSVQQFVSSELTMKELVSTANSFIFSSQENPL